MDRDNVTSIGSAQAGGLDDSRMGVVLLRQRCPVGARL
jgi:hypothetical protein